MYFPSGANRVMAGPILHD